ncbi:hypothetical protein [Vibrio sp. LaRot3]|uniref:hypothetical protein n=1 Tax=Vibrio sp. LaRot3 TaxID=2998829 RepID=UPI0022CE0F21|nr:hypothetical protein [Vibrio sp. LaRot3]MDA0148994.1 hypothetical protein [Vibrio sp. LaRot3]
MNFHSCTIVLNDHSTMVCKSVDQSLAIIDSHGTSSIDSILIDTTDGKRIRNYHDLSVEESIESLMSL